MALGEPAPEIGRPQAVQGSQRRRRAEMAGEEIQQRQHVAPIGG